MAKRAVKAEFDHVDWRNETRLYTEIGRRIKEARRRKGFTQEDLSERVSLSRPSISLVENGQQNISMYAIYEICFVLDVSIHTILPNNMRDS
ncbi:DNA-binding XRE family transcriptional regulator [Paenibacillus taihuensis]|uniref:DNA-binding XRE family transcriptional regulator n=1 Tax=Paenibacillus taihuensis TaxID=1156355 RepID=A0A3D9QUB0_9BACL|nr:helix-turn-helix transcriptional regulator [Paenibacillus taihuensis]REE67015.1 DNA-binding XRE family transcriptional regulator [Paenibacillus taihuensis]